jgi:hypothetical protein
MSGPTDTSLILTAGSEPPDRHAGPDRPLVGDPLDQRNNIWAASSLISQPAERERHTHRSTFRSVYHISIIITTHQMQRQKKAISHEGQHNLK